MLDDAQTREAADLLWTCWNDGSRIATLPETVRPNSRAEGYAIQATLESREDAPLYGWKIAATSAAGQGHIGVDGPLAGRLLASRAYEDGAEVPFGANGMAVAEPEFAFRLGTDLPPRDVAYDVVEVLAAVESLHPAIEIPDARFDDYAAAGGPQLIADNACAHQFVLGPAAPPSWREIDLVTHHVGGMISSGLMRDGEGANVLGDPRIALTWLASELSSLGLTLKAGQVITTGTCMVPLEVAPGDGVKADFGAIGSATVRFAET
ncbi:MAG: fumarylacetoacetate hydrolase family protein [Alphaproteobacteria bacterium]